MVLIVLKSIAVVNFILFLLCCIAGIVWWIKYPNFAPCGPWEENGALHFFTYTLVGFIFASISGFILLILA